MSAGGKERARSRGRRTGRASGCWTRRTRPGVFEPRKEGARGVDSCEVDDEEARTRSICSAAEAFSRREGASGTKARTSGPTAGELRRRMSHGGAACGRARERDGIQRTHTPGARAEHRAGLGATKAATTTERGRDPSPRPGAPSRVASSPSPATRLRDRKRSRTPRASRPPRTRPRGDERDRDEGPRSQRTPPSLDARARRGRLRPPRARAGRSPSRRRTSRCNTHLEAGRVRTWALRGEGRAIRARGSGLSLARNGPTSAAPASAPPRGRRWLPMRWTRRSSGCTPS